MKKNPELRRQAVKILDVVNAAVLAALGHEDMFVLGDPAPTGVEMEEQVQLNFSALDTDNRTKVKALALASDVVEQYFEDHADDPKLPNGWNVRTGSPTPFRRSNGGTVFASWLCIDIGVRATPSQGAATAPNAVVEKLKREMQDCIDNGDLTGAQLKSALLKELQNAMGSPASTKKAKTDGTVEETPAAGDDDIPF